MGSVEDLAVEWVAVLEEEEPAAGLVVEPAAESAAVGSAAVMAAVSAGRRPH